MNADQPQWDGTTVKDRNLQALALATQLIIEEKKQERKTRSASVKPSARNGNGFCFTFPPCDL